jgi:hypothetical protein
MCFGLLAIDIFLRIILIERKDAIKFMTSEEILALGGPIAEKPGNSATEESDGMDPSGILQYIRPTSLTLHSCPGRREGQGKREKRLG